MKNCEDCTHWKYNGITLFSGYCAMYSCSCNTAIYEHREPPRFLPMEGVSEQETHEQEVQEAQKEGASK